MKHQEFIIPSRRRRWNECLQRAPNWLNLQKLIYFESPSTRKSFRRWRRKTRENNAPSTWWSAFISLLIVIVKEWLKQSRREFFSSPQYLRLTLPSVTINPREQTKEKNKLTICGAFNHPTTSTQWAIESLQFKTRLYDLESRSSRIIDLAICERNALSTSSCWQWWSGK